MSTNIPIRFQQSSTSGQPSWQSREQQQPTYQQTHEQQQPQWREQQMYGQPQWQQQQKQEFQQPSQYGQKGWEQREQQQQKPSYWTEQQQPQQQVEQQRGYGERVEGRVGFGGKMTGELVEKQISGRDVTVADLSCLHSLLMITGHCYIKEHVLMKLCPDSQGLIKNWHKNVTIPNLERLCELSKSFGLTLPFHKSLEQREHEIKNVLRDNLQVLTDGEGLKDIKMGACLLEQHFAQTFMVACNEQLRELARISCGTVCENFIQIKQAVTQTQEYFPFPVVQSVLIRQGVSDRR